MTDRIHIHEGRSTRRHCSAAAPMTEADKDKYQWTHHDAAFVKDFFNLALYTCPHCNLTFHAPKRPA